MLLETAEPDFGDTEVNGDPLYPEVYTKGFLVSCFEWVTEALMEENIFLP